VDFASVKDWGGNQKNSPPSQLRCATTSRGGWGSVLVKSKKSLYGFCKGFFILRY